MRMRVSNILSTIEILNHVKSITFFLENDMKAISAVIMVLSLFLGGCHHWHHHGHGDHCPPGQAKKGNC